MVDGQGDPVRVYSRPAEDAAWEFKVATLKFAAMPSTPAELAWRAGEAAPVRDLMNIMVDRARGIDRPPRSDILGLGVYRSDPSRVHEALDELAADERACAQVSEQRSIEFEKMIDTWCDERGIPTSTGGASSPGPM